MIDAIGLIRLSTNYCARLFAWKYFINLSCINTLGSMINYEALFNVSYGMYIVCSGDDTKGNGFISNSVFQVTAEPAQIAVCCNKDNYSAELIVKSAAFSISILNQDAPSTLIGTFGYKSGRDIDKLNGLRIKQGETGVPIVLDESIAYIECALNQTFDVGSHLVFIGEVVQAENLTEGIPLTYAYYRNTRKGVAPKNAPTFIDKSKVVKPAKRDGGKKYKCVICGHIYDPEVGDPENNIVPGTDFVNLPSGWNCPVCGADKDDFIEN